MHHYRKSKASPRQEYDAAAAQGRKALEKRLRQQDSSEDGLVKKVLEAGKQEDLNLICSTPVKMLGMVAEACNSSTEKVETGGFPRLAGKSAYPTGCSQ